MKLLKTYIKELKVSKYELLEWVFVGVVVVSITIGHLEIAILFIIIVALIMSFIRRNKNESDRSEKGSDIR